MVTLKSEEGRAFALAASSARGRTIREQGDLFLLYPSAVGTDDAPVWHVRIAMSNGVTVTAVFEGEHARDGAERFFGSWRKQRRKLGPRYKAARVEAVRQRDEEGRAADARSIASETGWKPVEDDA